MSLKVAVSLILIAALCGAAGEASADAYDAALTRAVAAKEAALDVNEPSRWLEALRLFQQADEIRSSGDTKYELGFAAAQLRQFDLAVESYGAAIELGLGDAALARAKKFVSDHASSMARLNVTGPTGTEIYISDVLRGRLPLSKPLIVFSGTVEVEARTGDGSTQHSVSVDAGKLETLRLEPPPSSLAAEIMPVDAPIPPAPGPRQPPPDHRPDPSPANAPWIVVAAGAGVAVLGAVMIPVSNGRIDAARSELDPLCAVPDGSDACLHAEPGEREAAQDEVDRIATWKAMRIGAFVTAGVGTVALATGIVMLVSRPSSRPSSAASITWIAVDLPGFADPDRPFGFAVHGVF